ncbi:arsenical pump-driving ATPase [Ornithinimicrobium sediminis]|uniref:arsenical pump-driving ATPase n=1 Tax=Ornithinimicrobium sediminis TaxID=2904603 RepID=UPI001E389DD7|nr:arsenical pump-driving ATPase [Ornithinimicrobium sediminis]MCE0487229.1 arsenical pump-driving ATPase [Ornithinimicrobium sediminis]
MTTTATGTRAASLSLLQDLPKHLFLTGKGGVGKTAVACASAVSLARAGARVLLVSTDPASNVGHVFETTIGHTVTAVPGVPGLWALEIDPEAAAHAYRERIIAPVRGVLPEAEVASITEQLSGACTTEIASFNEFTDLLADPSVTAGYDHVVFDTAPTGHTIRLLQLPGSWTGYLEVGKGDASCLGPLSGLEKQRSAYAGAVGALADPGLTRMGLVCRAQKATIAEAERTRRELAAIGIADMRLVVNATMPDTGSRDPLARAVVQREQAAMSDLPAGLAALPRDMIPLRPVSLVGVDAVASLLDTDPVMSDSAMVPAAPARPDAPLRALVDELAERDHGLVMVMGKGGVGKTTLAAAVAVELARRGRSVHLTTTDPAAHLEQTLAAEVDGLDVSRIDPAQATAAYRERVMRTKGAALDAEGRAHLAEDLRSPCTEEVAVFQMFSQAVNEAARRFVVMDTAPTGHTLLLMDAAGSYHREIVRQMDAGTRYTTPLMRLQDPGHTHVVLTTLPETTPVLEALELQADLRRAGIEPWAWVVNQSLAAAHAEDPVLLARAATETLALDRVAADGSGRHAVVPLLRQEPVGAGPLTELLG